MAGTGKKQFRSGTGTQRAKVKPTADPNGNRAQKRAAAKETRKAAKKTGRD